MDGSDSKTCGICFSDDDNTGKAIRGIIDSCDHYFCFVCIMEWAKVESRCPLCKQRFSSIRRPPKPGVFASERIVPVPERNQAYVLFGNTTIGPFDPYAQVNCSVCNGTEDECLLLLCDLCDCASHTYCVGMGATLPEGDWFCRDCQISRTEHNNIQKGDDAVDGDGQNVTQLQPETAVGIANDIYETSTYETSTPSRAAENDVLISEIVHEDNPVYGRKRARYTTASVACEGQTSLADGGRRPDERTPRQDNRTSRSIDDAAAATEARTLSRCRNVHYYIRALRDNWDGLQSGSLRFSSGSGEPCRNKKRTVPRSSCEQHCSSSKGIQQNTTQEGSSYDIDKAWKVMERVMKKTPRKSSTINFRLNYPSSERSTLNRATNGSSFMHKFRSQQLGNNELESTVREKHYAYGREGSVCVSQKLEKLKQKVVEKSQNCTAATCSPRFSSYLSSWKIRNTSDIREEDGPRLLYSEKEGASSNNSSRQNIAEYDMVSVETRLKEENSKSEFSISSSTKVNTFDWKTTCGRGSAKRKTRNDDCKRRKDDDPKSEIQSLVKINLKLLTRDKQLGTDLFKEVARQATHTIMAACGLGHSRHVVDSCPSPVCNHSEQIKQLRKSTLLPNSCRECFFVFVKDVVDSILSQKIFSRGP